MSKSKISGKRLSIQLGRSEMQIVLVDKGTEILHSVSVPMPSGAVEDGMIRNVEAVTQTLKAAVKTPELKRVRQAVFTLCTTQVITETVTTPELTGKKLEKLLRANMDMYFPVDVQDYRLVWQVIGPKYSEGGLKEQAVQLWEVPNAMIGRYYTVANACGLAVDAIDYCGNSVATAIDASYSKNTKAAKQRKKLDLNQEITFGRKGRFEAEEAPEPMAQGRRNPDTDLHILLEKDLLGMTFVQNGQIVLQRFIRRSAYGAYQFGELSMMVEYFRAMDIGRGSFLRGIVSGADARDGQMVAELAETLDIPVTELAAYYAPELCLCMGAARTNMDFGISTLNSVTSARQQLQGQLWQYALVLAGGLAVLAVGMHLLQSRLGWDAEITRLNNTYQTLAIQHQQTAGYADNYNNYKAAYDAYNADWDVIFQNVRLQNDNLVLLLQELEETVPENASVTGMSIKPNYMQVSFACKTKEEAAYLIMSLRELKYADPNQMQVSDLKGGGKGAAKTYGSGYADETPPVEGGSTAWNPEWMDKEAFVQAVVAMNANDRKTLKDMYGKQPISGYTYDDLRNHESGGFDDAREPAIREMFNYNPFAMDIFKDLLKAEYEASKVIDEDGDELITFENTVLIKYIEDDVWDYMFDHQEMPEDLEDAREILEVMLTAVFRETDKPYTREERINALEDLFRTDAYLEENDRQYMDSTYCHYLEAEMEPGTAERFPFLDVERIAQEGFQTGIAEVDAALNALLEETETPPEETEPTEPKPTEPEEDDGGSNEGAIQLAIGMALEAYLEKDGPVGTIAGIDVDKEIGKYLSGKQTSYDRFVDAYIEDGLADKAIEDLLYKSIRYPNEVPDKEPIQNLLDKIENGDKIREPLDSAIMRCNANVAKRIKKELDKEKENNKESTAETTTEETAAADSKASSPYSDGRIYFTVTLGYSEELLNAELNRKGLSYADKILELEVAAE